MLVIKTVKKDLKLLKKKLFYAEKQVLHHKQTYKKLSSKVEDTINNTLNSNSNLNNTLLEKCILLPKNATNIKIVGSNKDDLGHYVTPLKHSLVVDLNGKVTFKHIFIIFTSVKKKDTYSKKFYNDSYLKVHEKKLIIDNMPDVLLNTSQQYLKSITFNKLLVLNDVDYNNLQLKFNNVKDIHLDHLIKNLSILDNKSFLYSKDSNCLDYFFNQKTLPSNYTNEPLTSLKKDDFNIIYENKLKNQSDIKKNYFSNWSSDDILLLEKYLRLEKYYLDKVKVYKSQIELLNMKSNSFDDTFSDNYSEDTNSNVLMIEDSSSTIPYNSSLEEAGNFLEKVIVTKKEAGTSLEEVIDPKKEAGTKYQVNFDNSSKMLCLDDTLIELNNSVNIHHIDDSSNSDVINKNFNIYNSNDEDV